MTWLCFCRWLPQIFAPCCMHGHSPSCAAKSIWLSGFNMNTTQASSLACFLNSKIPLVSKNYPTPRHMPHDPRSSFRLSSKPPQNIPSWRGPQTCCVISQWNPPPPNSQETLDCDTASECHKRFSFLKFFVFSPPDLSFSFQTAPYPMPLS